MEALTRPRRSLNSATGELSLPTRRRRAWPRRASAACLSAYHSRSRLVQLRRPAHRFRCYGQGSIACSTQCVAVYPCFSLRFFTVSLRLISASAAIAPNVSPTPAHWPLVRRWSNTKTDSSIVTILRVTVIVTSVRLP